MERQSYYKILAYALLAIFIFDIIRITLILNGGSQALFSSGKIKNIIAILVICFETFNSSKQIKTTNYILFALAFIGFLFVIMHWPFGHILFLGSLLAILTVLFISALKSDSNKTEKLIVLAFPIIHYLFMTFTILRLPLHSFISITELLIIGAISLTLLYRLTKHKV